MDDSRWRWKKENGVVPLGGVCCVKMKSRKGEGGREGFVAVVTVWVSCSRELLAFDGVTQETYPHCIFDFISLFKKRPQELLLVPYNLFTILRSWYHSGSFAKAPTGRRSALLTYISLFVVGPHR